MHVLMAITFREVHSSLEVMDDEPMITASLLHYRMEQARRYKLSTSYGKMRVPSRIPQILSSFVFIFDR